MTPPNPLRRSDLPSHAASRSLRRRLWWWMLLIFGTTLVLFSGADLLQERRLLIANDTARATALLEHLAAMPEFHGRSADVIARLGSVRGVFRPTGLDVVLVPKEVPPSAVASTVWPLLAKRPLRLSDGAFELRVRGDSSRLREVVRRSIVYHLLHGLLALGGLFFMTDWVLRHNLLSPLARISHQLRHIGRGGGWLPVLPETDRELLALRDSIADLGPSLESQVSQWVEGERRAAVALELQLLRQKLAGDTREVRVAAGDLLAREILSPDGKRALRSVLRQLDRVSAALSSSEFLHLPQNSAALPTTHQEVKP